MNQPHLHHQLQGYPSETPFYPPFIAAGSHYPPQHPSAANQVSVYGNFVYSPSFMMPADMALVQDQQQILLQMQSDSTDQVHYPYYPQYQSHQPQHHPHHHHHAQHPTTVVGPQTYMYAPTAQDAYASTGPGNIPAAYLHPQPPQQQQQQQQQHQQHHQLSVPPAMANHGDATGAGGVDHLLLLEHQQQHQPHLLHQQSQAQVQQQHSAAVTSVKPGTAAASALTATAEQQQQLQQQRRPAKQHNTNQALEHINKLMLKLDTEEIQTSPDERRDRILMYTHIALTIPVVWNYVCQLSELKDEADPAKVYGFLHHLNQNNVSADEWESAIREKSVIFKVEEERLRKKMCPILRIQGRNPEKIVTMCDDIKQKPSQRYKVQDQHQLSQLKEFFFKFLPKELNLKAPEQLIVDFASVLVIYSDSDSFDRVNSLLPQLAFTKLCLGYESPSEPPVAPVSGSEDPVEAAKRRWEGQLTPCKCNRLSLYAVPGKWQSYPLVSDAQWELNQTESGTIMSTTFNIKPVKLTATGVPTGAQTGPSQQQQQQLPLQQEVPVVAKEVLPATSVSNTSSLEPLVIEPVKTTQQHSATAAAAAAAEHYTGSPILASQEGPIPGPTASIYGLRESAGFPTQPPPPPPPPLPQVPATTQQQQPQMSHHHSQQQNQQAPSIQSGGSRMFNKPPPMQQPPPPLHQHSNHHQNQPPHHHQQSQQGQTAPPGPFPQVPGSGPLTAGPPPQLPPPTSAQAQHPPPPPPSQQGYASGPPQHKRHGAERQNAMPPRFRHGAPSGPYAHGGPGDQTESVPMSQQQSSIPPQQHAIHGIPPHHQQQHQQQQQHIQHHQPLSMVPPIPSSLSSSNAPVPPPAQQQSQHQQPPPPPTMPPTSAPLQAPQHGRHGPGLSGMQSSAYSGPGNRGGAPSIRGINNRGRGPYRGGRGGRMDYGGYVSSHVNQQPSGPAEFHLKDNDFPEISSEGGPASIVSPTALVPPPPPPPPPPVTASIPPQPGPQSTSVDIQSTVCYDASSASSLSTASSVAATLSNGSGCSPEQQPQLQQPQLQQPQLQQQQQLASSAAGTSYAAALKKYVPSGVNTKPLSASTSTVSASAVTDGAGVQSPDDATTVMVPASPPAVPPAAAPVRRAVASACPPTVTGPPNDTLEVIIDRDIVGHDGSSALHSAGRPPPDYSQTYRGGHQSRGGKHHSTGAGFGPPQQHQQHGGYPRGGHQGFPRGSRGGSLRNQGGGPARNGGGGGAI